MSDLGESDILEGKSICFDVLTSEPLQVKVYLGEPKSSREKKSSFTIVSIDDSNEPDPDN